MGAFAADPFDDFGWGTRLSTGPRPRIGSRPWWLRSLGEVALEFRDRDEASASLGRDCCDHRDDATVERGQADAERLGGLLARVRESLDPISEFDVGDATRGR